MSRGKIKNASPVIDGAAPGHTESGVSFVEKERSKDAAQDLRLNPELRLCAKFDETSIARFPVAPRGKMGVRVLDNCAEEHIM